MIWVDREAKKLKERNLSLEWVDDMKTPSGRIHVGSLRGVVIHDLIYKVLKEQGVNVRFSYIFNNMDPMDGMPSYLDKEKWEKYMGMPLYKIPSPEKGSVDFAQHYAGEFIEVFNSINCHPEIIWSTDLYRSGKMNDAIRLVLDNADKVRKIYQDVAKTERAADWFPYNPVCRQCGKIGTTNVYRWDGQYVYYRCEPQVVEWATGCGYDGKVEPINENGKLPWKLDWPAHWKVIGITVESSGKDHMSAGGSYDMASHFCREIFHIEPPEAFGGYEWFTIGGRKMSSSKGIGTSAKEASAILPPEVFRFLLVRTHIETHLDFNPFGNTIPNLFDDYDRCLNAYFSKLENKIPQGKPGEVMMDFSRFAELSAVEALPAKRLTIPRFRTVANLIRQNKDPKEFFEQQKKEPLNKEESAMLEERIKYAKIFLSNYDQEKNDASRYSQPFMLSEKQKEFLTALKIRLTETSSLTLESAQNIIFSILKEKDYKPREVFQSFYRIISGKDHGPKAGELLMSQSKEAVIAKINEALSGDKNPQNSEIKFNYPVLDNDQIFSISPPVKKQYPSINIGIAIIKDVSIITSNPELEKRIREFVESQSGLTNEIIGTYPEIQSYRKLYKMMGIDWHSRRPSPEALLRRIALNKGLYSINTCVDAYNLVVMNNRVSSGAFDLDKIKFPTILRHPEEGEKILLLGDKEPTLYKPSELAYFDRNGGYNIDFNFRDSQSTAVTLNTKNILINIDGVYDITRGMVEKTLKETIAEIIKYCGGKVELAGMVTA